MKLFKYLTFQIDYVILNVFVMPLRIVPCYVHIIFVTDIIDKFIRWRIQEQLFYIHCSCLMLP